MLFHVSEDAGIQRFAPRVSVRGEAVVWAVDDDRLRNYLVPRDCPRVTCYAGRTTTAADIERVLGASRAVVAIEAGWYERLRTCRLYCYALPADTFQCVDDCAGYFVSRAAVVPARVAVVDDAIGELVRRGVELRVLPDLWDLHDAVAASSLQFSMIRMRNARPKRPVIA
jgi:hypothetical protein